MVEFFAVAAPTHNDARAHNHRPHGYIALGSSPFRFGERHTHPTIVFFHTREL
jgi:hypothetical protein